MKALKYFLVLVIPFFVFISFTSRGWQTFIHVILIFGFVQLLEFFIKLTKENFTKEEEQIEKKKKFYTYLLYATQTIQLVFLVFFFYAIQEAYLPNSEFFSLVFSMGITCGIIGINVGHGLEHINNRVRQILLFNLSRHSDHYYNGSKHYQLLKTAPESPKVPSGHQGNMLLSFFPPL